MSRLVSGLVFFGVSFAILGGLHYYFWARLVRDPGLPQPWRSVLTVALIVLCVSMPASFALGRLLSPAHARWLLWPVYVWMGSLLFLFLALLVGDVVRLVASLARSGGPPDSERRRLLSQVLAGGAAAAAGGLAAFSVRNALRQVQVVDVPVTLAKLPKALDGFTIVQLTDVHIGGGPTLARDWLADVVARTNALAPDLIAITGDLVDGSVERLRDEVAPLKDLKARHGVYFVTGNHEYYAGAEAWIAELGRLGIRCLRNERLPITDGLDLAGVDDYHARPDLARALAGRDPNRALVLLAHQPRAVHEAAAQGVCLQLSGHTHGGQIWPWNFLVRLQQPYVAGLVREGQTQLYVSRGTGYWGPPMRLGTHAEITRVTLKAATS